jgi:glyoxylase-like metal-dependent hydrolase (beta-lactamase superfamily II)
MQEGMPAPVGASHVTHVPGADAADVVVIDTLTGGLEGVTAGYLLTTPRPVLVECGPAMSIAATIAALRMQGLDPDDLAYLVVSHVHLDHAGGAGDLLAAFPQAQVIVSERGARHLNDPTRLNDSARRVYGPLFDTVYGPCTPVPADRVTAVSGGERLDLGGGRTLEVLDTPGHAKHHIGVFDPDLGALFTGDSVGVRLVGMSALRPATPPADFNFETMLRSLALYQERAPEHLYLAHFGAIGPAPEALADAEERLRAWVTAAEAAWRATPPHEDEIEHVARMLDHQFADELHGPAASEPSEPGAPEVAQPEVRTPDALAPLGLLNDARSNAAGILRYLRRRDEGTLTPLG